jgi:hypothetical protein
MAHKNSLEWNLKKNRRLISAGPHPHNSDSAKSLKNLCHIGLIYILKVFGMCSAAKKRKYGST